MPTVRWCAAEAGRQAASTRRSIAPPIRTTSGRSANVSCPGIERSSGISALLGGERRRPRGGGLVGGLARGATLDLLDESGDRRLHALEEGRRVDAHPDDQGAERKQHPRLAPVEVGEVPVLVLRERVEDDALDRPQHVAGAQDDADRRDDGEDRVALEGAEEDEELTHEAEG